ncbi:MAG: hypothetical protein RIG84_03465 [Roseovarius sp.]
MSEVLKREEATPATYPAAPAGLSDAAAALDADMIWQRIEAYIAHRWTDREVKWTVEGPGEWEPDLTPATITATEIWQDDAWTATTLTASALGGYVLPGEGPYRFTADVGSGSVPAAVSEAFRRLAEYMAEPVDKHGAGRFEVDLGGAIKEGFDRNPAWVAKSMQLSGAGDLLRPYRRA